MFVAINKITGERIEIERAIRKSNKYCCPECGGELLTKMGRIKIWHFAHKNKKLSPNCSLAKESIEHMKGKKAMKKQEVSTPHVLVG